ncbi:Sodium/hydrogen exchanger 11 [Camelus dromedarius]|uniref:Sodium/hydrogen exchanger 11 n=1 Tax=Camelus dromedarius TaxID=9838 RepID=A0A5N4CPL9_CAMDR|nr:Sodium/hydrogen exchanger 11 [Camelus dromedarius]
MTIDNVTMKFVIIVYGSVIDTKTEAPYLAPCILPKTCEQVQGTSDLSKLLVILASKPVKNSNSKVMGETITGREKMSRDMVPSYNLNIIILSDECGWKIVLLAQLFGKRRRHKVPVNVGRHSHSGSLALPELLNADSYP